MSNHVGVLLAALGLFAAAWGTFGFEAGLIAGGGLLTVGALLLLIDFPTGKG